LIARLGWFAALAYMGVIFALSSVPGEDLPLPQFFLSDKIAHFVTYSILGALIAFRSGITAVLKGNPVTAWTKGGWIAPAVGIVYGLLDEVHQLFVPNRNFDLRDWAVDIAGILIGFWLARKWDERRQTRLPQRNAKI
jgi:VanZ family protein